MQVKSTYLNIWQIAYPIMLASVAQMLVGLTDTAFLARVGEVELGASAIAGVFYFVLVISLINYLLYHFLKCLVFYSQVFF